MYVIIAGGRTISDPALVERAVRESGFDVTRVICGGAPGVDTLGEKWAEANGVPVDKYPAAWATYGKAAGPLRNAQMARAAKEAGGALILIWDGESRGSASMLQEATAAGIPVFQLRV